MFNVKVSSRIEMPYMDVWICLRTIIKFRCSSNYSRHLCKNINKSKPYLESNTYYIPSRVQITVKEIFFDLIKKKIQ